LSLPDSVVVVEIAEPGAPDVLRASRRTRPRPGPGEVLVAVAAAGVNRPDLLQRQGRYAPPPGTTDIPGLEVAGSVAETGPGVTAPAVGEHVCALLPGGGYAEYAAAPAVQCLPVPEGLGLVAAAALPEAVFTVWTNVFEDGHLEPGEALLVHGGSSGIGTTAIQMAVALGSRVLVTAGSDEKCAACLRLGAERAVNYRVADFVPAAREWTEGRGVDVILDMVGGSYLPRNLRALAPRGRLVQIAFLESSRAELDLALVMQKRLVLTGSTLRPRSVEEKGRIATAVRERIWPLVASGRIRPVIHATFPLERAADAHRLMESGAHVGKIVLTTGPRN
jgi:putative PIG3 family NAD(P)H quinone oxidoreductase